MSSFLTKIGGKEKLSLHDPTPKPHIMKLPLLTFTLFQPRSEHGNRTASMMCTTVGPQSSVSRTVRFGAFPTAVTVANGGWTVRVVPKSGALFVIQIFSVKEPDGANRVVRVMGALILEKMTASGTTW